MQLFNSSKRVHKQRRAQAAMREPQGVHFLLALVQSVSKRGMGGATVVFTSANSGEGVSHVVRFFAEKLAIETGKPTLVVNAERLHDLSITDVVNMPGLLTKVGRLDSVTEVTAGTDEILVTGNGKLDQQKLSKLGSETGLQLLKTLGENFGCTLIDCPAISLSYEAAMLAPDVDGVVLVVEADSTKRDQILRARQTIEVAKGNLMGLVLNRRRYVVPEKLYRRL